LTAQKVHQLISRGLIYACHDCSEGGLALALAEMSLAGELGLEVELGKLPVATMTQRADSWLLFSESLGRYLVEVAPADAPRLEALLADTPHACIGLVTEGNRMVVHGLAGERVIELPVAALRRAFRGHLTGEAA
ncbi:MAG: phosphoribosylformylglycinamidine synthase, partial [Chloroflexi bacterium]|nr:phosphoribosylformylglycinamidine synthase [Chloroflexota bacterium]